MIEQIVSREHSFEMLFFFFHFHFHPEAPCYGAGVNSAHVYIPFC